MEAVIPVAVSLLAVGAIVSSVCAIVLHLLSGFLNLTWLTIVGILFGPLLGMGPIFAWDNMTNTNFSIDIYLPFAAAGALCATVLLAFFISGSEAKVTAHQK